LNPEIGLPPLDRATQPLKVLIAGGGPAGMSSALYMARRGHQVALSEKTGHLGGQFALAWQAPGKEKMKEGLDGIERSVRSSGASILMNTAVDVDLVRKIQPELLVWAIGAVQNIPKIKGLDDQYVMTTIEYFQGKKEVKGPRILIIGAGRSGIEIAEKLGRKGYDVVATKRTDPIGSMMEMITRKLTLMRIEQMDNVTLMPHTTVIEFREKNVEIEKDGERILLEPFQNIILASGMQPASEPDERIANEVTMMEIIGDAKEVQDIFTAVHAGYNLALKY
jgi:NADPH-dependent 2,4-dienoyl-CoA reductase/sulfur reductase-like enzyme